MGTRLPDATEPAPGEYEGSHQQPRDTRIDKIAVFIANWTRVEVTQGGWG